MSKWIEHDGSGMPIPGNTLVYVRLKNGFDDSFCEKPWRAHTWHDPEPLHSNWHAEAGNDQIVAYRVVQP